MSWQIKSEGGARVVVLDSELGIQNAAEFHQAMLPLAANGGAVRINAQAAKSVHTAIMQILYALSQAMPDFAVINASEDFQAIEARMGFSLARSDQIQSPINVLEPA
jgi:anti-anti-sigma regulatory factor